MKSIFICIVATVAFISVKTEDNDVDSNEEPMNSDFNQTNPCEEFPGFTSINASDSYSYDIKYKSEFIIINDLFYAADYCLNCLACEGFDSYGWLKWRIVAEDERINMSKNFCLYIKNSVQMEQKGNYSTEFEPRIGHKCPENVKLYYFISRLIELIEFKGSEHTNQQTIYKGSKDLIEFPGYSSEYDSLRLDFEGSSNENITVEGLKFGRYIIQHHSNTQYATVDIQENVVFELSDVRNAFFESVNSDDQIFLSENSEKIIKLIQESGFYFIKYLNTSEIEKTGIMWVK